MSQWTVIKEAWPKLNRKLKKQLIKRLVASILNLVPIDPDDFFTIIDSGVSFIEAKSDGLASAMNFDGVYAHGSGGNYLDWSANINARLAEIVKDFKLEQVARSKVNT
jgi:hypothetical protein